MWCTVLRYCLTMTKSAGETPLSPSEHDRARLTLSRCKAVISRCSLTQGQLDMSVRIANYAWSPRPPSTESRIRDVRPIVPTSELLGCCFRLQAEVSICNMWKCSIFGVHGLKSPGESIALSALSVPMMHGRK